MPARWSLQIEDAFPKTRKMGCQNDLLKLAGEALYGRQWQTPLSRDLGVSDRTIRNWATGGGTPADLSSRLLSLLRARGDQLENVIALIERNQNGAS